MSNINEKPIHLLCQGCKYNNKIFIKRTLHNYTNM